MFVQSAIITFECVSCKVVLVALTDTNMKLYANYDLSVITELKDSSRSQVVMLVVVM